MVAAYSIYANQLIPKGHGHPLWEPDPDQEPAVELGDVGYLKDGGFIRLFNASKQPGDPSNALGVPEGYEPLMVNPSDIRRRSPLPKKPEYISSEGVVDKGADISASSGSLAPVSIGGGFSFSCRKQQGALLIMGDVAYRQDALRLVAFYRYIQKHHRSWLQFAKDNDRPVLLHELILVTGCDKTSDWACAAFSDKSSSASIEFQAGDTTILDGSVKIWGSWSRTSSVDSHAGPHRLIAPSDASPVIPTSENQLLTLQSTRSRSASNASSDAARPASASSSAGAAHNPISNQCVFLRGYRTCDRMTWWRRKLTRDKPNDGFVHVPPPDLHLGHEEERKRPPPGGNPPSDLHPPSGGDAGPAAGAGAGASSSSGANQSSASDEPATKQEAPMDALSMQLYLDLEMDIGLLFDLDKEPTPLDAIFNYIFEHSDANLAVVHDKDLIYLMRISELTDDFNQWIRKLAPRVLMHEEVGMLEYTYLVVTKRPLSIVITSDAEIPPTVPNLTGQIERAGEYPAAQGCNAEVWIGEWVQSRSSRKVSVRILRTFRKEEGGLREKMWPKRLSRFLPHWVNFDHPNVLSLLGICWDFSPTPAMISPWMHCNAIEFIHHSPPDQSTLSRRVKLSLQVAKGLQYLHNYIPSIVHGDIKGLNVLVSYGGEAVLGGFGAARVTVDPERDDDPWKKGSIRWMAPELLAAGDPTTSASITASSDIYAFGCLILELISGRDPYYDLETDISVVMRISSGGTPPIPQDVYVPHDAKALMNDCWSESRPDINSVVTRMIHCAEKARQASQNLPPYSELQVRSGSPLLVALPEDVHEHSGWDQLFHERMTSSPTVEYATRLTRSPQGVPRSALSPTSHPSLQRAHSVKKGLSSPDLQRIAASLKSVAGFESIASLLSQIDQTCKMVKANRAQMSRLAQRCGSVLSAVKDVKLKPHLQLRTLERLFGIFSSVAHSLQTWSHLGSLASLMKRNEISNTVEDLHSQLTNFIVQLTSTEQHMRSTLEDLRVWKEHFLVDQSADNEEVTKLLVALAREEKLVEEAIGLSEEDFTSLTELFRMTLGFYERESTRHRELQAGLFKLSTCRGPLLPVAELAGGEVVRIGRYPVAGTSTFDIWQGVWLGNEKVALKVLRGVSMSPVTRRRFHREAAIWKQVFSKDLGKSILPFYGVCSDDGPYPYLISPWMKNGHVNRYLKDHPDMNPMSFIKQIAQGLEVLHSFDPPIVHGTLKGSNVLISDSGHALLSDFGLSKMLEDISGETPFTQSGGVSDSFRWFAPELLDSTGSLSTPSDIYSFGMTVLEILTRDHPWAGIKNTCAVLVRCSSGLIPTRPMDAETVKRGLDDALWNLLEKCWTTDPCQRPDVREVIELLPPV